MRLGRKEVAGAYALAVCLVAGAGHAQPQPPEAIPPEGTPETPPDPPPLPEEAPDGEGGASAEAVVEPEGAPEATPDPTAGSGGAPELTPEELAEIEAALGADAEVQAKNATKDDDVAASQTSNTGPGIAATAAAFLPNISIILDAAAAMSAISFSCGTGDSFMSMNGGVRGRVTSRIVSVSPGLDASSSCDCSVRKPTRPENWHAPIAR